MFENLWTPVGAGVKSQEEVDALALYLFGDGPEGREAIRELDATIADIPGLEGLHLLEGVLDDALERPRVPLGGGGPRTLSGRTPAGSALGPIRPACVGDTQHLMRHSVPELDMGALPMTASQRVANLLGIALPATGLILAIVLLWDRLVGPVELGVAASLYVLTGLGVSVGFHRLFAHRSFEDGT